MPACLHRARSLGFCLQVGSAASELVASIPEHRALQQRETADTLLQHAWECMDGSRAGRITCLLASAPSVSCWTPPR